jgi:hypothetical protein
MEMEPIVIEARGFPTPPAPGQKSLEQYYGKFAFQELSGGNIRVIDNWERDNIVTLKVRVRGPYKYRTVQLHQKIAPMFQDLMAVVYQQFPNYPIEQLGGFCPRHKMHDPARSLSVHSWGAAVDINWKNNPVSRKLITDFPPGFIDVFTGVGWTWGGNWRSVKDAMHVEFVRGA